MLWPGGISQEPRRPRHLASHGHAHKTVRFRFKGKWKRRKPLGLPATLAFILFSHTPFPTSEACSTARQETVFILVVWDLYQQSGTEGACPNQEISMNHIRLLV